MMTENVEKNGAWARFMHWYESYQGKRVVGMVYSIGAAVVIVGALFKIMHFPGAGAVLMVGMITEAILFLIGCLDKPHAEFHWHNVFPQLLEHGTDPKLLEEMQGRPVPTLLGGGSASSGATSTVKVPSLSDKDMESLKKGIDDLAKTATQLSSLEKVAVATTQLTERLDAASQAAEQFVQAGKVIEDKGVSLSAAYGQVANEMELVARGTKEYGAQVTAIAKQLTGLNTVYELQINVLQSQVDAYKMQADKITSATSQVETLASSVKQMTSIASETLKSQEAYMASTKQLAAQVADLNKVYGNMLNALS